MLIRIRNQRRSLLSSIVFMSDTFPPVIPSDYSTQLTFLLRYPPPPVDNAPAPITNEQSFTTSHVILLLRQALSLQVSPTVATGASVVYENRNLLNIASEVPEPPPPPTKRRAQQGRTSAMNDGPLRMLQRPIHVRYGSSGSLGFPDIAKNILDRGESLGINRTVMNAVSEIKVTTRYETPCQSNLLITRSATCPIYQPRSTHRSTNQRHSKCLMGNPQNNASLGRRVRGLRSRRKWPN